MSFGKKKLEQSAHDTSSHPFLLFDYFCSSLMEVIFRETLNKIIDEYYNVIMHELRLL